MKENSRRISYVTYDAALNGIENGLSHIHHLARYVVILPNESHFE